MYKHKYEKYTNKNKIIMNGGNYYLYKINDAQISFKIDECLVSENLPQSYIDKCNKLYNIFKIKIVSSSGEIYYEDDESYLINHNLYIDFEKFLKEGNIMRSLSKKNIIEDCEENTKLALQYFCQNNERLEFIESYIRKNKCILDITSTKYDKIRNFSEILTFITMFKISSDIHNILIKKEKNDDIYQPIIKYIPKYITEHQSRDEIAFVNLNGERKLYQKDKIIDFIFDSGNDGPIFIGKNIYDTLKQNNLILNEIPNIISIVKGVTSQTEIKTSNMVYFKVSFQKKKQK